MPHVVSVAKLHIMAQTLRHFKVCCDRRAVSDIAPVDTNFRTKINAAQCQPDPVS